MKEIEKRRGINGQEIQELRARTNSHYAPTKEVKRTLLIKVENDDFTSDPNVLVDIKVKMIDDSTLLAVKHGSWHGDAARQEYEVHFDRNNLSSLISFLHLLTFGKFVLVSTRRTIWQTEGLTITLDEYQGLDKALFEVETDGHEDESKIDEAFALFGVAPMNSEETVEFVNSINQAGAKISLEQTTPQELAGRMVELHTC